MILIIFILMYGFDTHYYKKPMFSDIEIDAFATDMEAPPGSSGAFFNDFNNIYSYVWIWHTLLEKN